MLPMVVSLGVLSAQYGISLSYAQFVFHNIIPTLIFIPVIWLSIHLVFRPETTAIGSFLKQFVEGKYKDLGRMKSGETKVLRWLLLTISAWVVGGYLGVQTGVIALLFGGLLFMPEIGVLGPRDLEKINWDMVIFFGAILGIPSIMVNTGLTLYIEAAVVGPMLNFFVNVLGNYIGYGIGTSLFMVISNFALPSTVPTAAIFGPSLLNHASNMGVDLRFATFVNGLNWLLSGFFPYQLTPLLLLWPLGG